MLLDYERKRSPEGRRPLSRFVRGGTLGAVVSVPCLILLFFLNHGGENRWVASVLKWIFWFPDTLLKPVLRDNENWAFVLAVVFMWFGAVGFLIGGVSSLVVRTRKGDCAK
jgi:hypothetical protein